LSFHFHIRAQRLEINNKWLLLSQKNKVIKNLLSSVIFTDLIVLLSNTSSQIIKKHGNFGEIFGKNATYEARNTIDRDLPYKINKK